MKKILVACCMTTTFGVFAQVNKDSVLANERTMDRPLNVHKGQLRVTGGYGFEYISKRYGDDGGATQLKELGMARAHHTSYLNVKFGLLEFLQLQAQAGYQTQNVRYPQNVIFGYPDLSSNTVVSTQNKIAGIEDLSLGLDFRLPLKNRKIDVLLSSGATLPVAQYKQKQPDNTLKEDVNFWEINYSYRTPMGRGVPTFQFGGATKIRLKNWAFTFTGDYRRAFSETTNREWTSQLNDNQQFEYQHSDYKVSLPGELRGSAMIEFQPSSIVNMFIEAKYMCWQNGWRETDIGKEKLPDQKYIAASPGFEIIITPRVWFRETINFPLSGANTDHGVQFLSTLSYNLFIF